MPTPNILFTPLTIKEITFKNRIWLSPMCQYSAQNGHVSDWHLVHLGSRAVGGAGLIMVEATAVNPEGRISAGDTGIWSDAHIAGFKNITDFNKTQGAISGIQLAHAGRKASTPVPWTDDNKTWPIIGPSPVPFDERSAVPKEMTKDDMTKVVNDFISATKRCVAAGFEVLELHMAHGYLMHEFLSPISNHRKDEYGGVLVNRMRFPLEIAQAVRDNWPAHLPLFVRISATDWAAGSEELNYLENEEIRNAKAWDLSQSILFCNKLNSLGVDLIDCSTGGSLAKADIPVQPSYQVPFSAMIKKKCNMLTAAVGMIIEPEQANVILSAKQADAIMMGREFLRNPYWPMEAQRHFAQSATKPIQYGRS